MALEDRKAEGAPPVLSIVTPCLNAGGYIEDLILSVRRQVGGHVEHVVIDGGSTDETTAILRKYTDENLVWISEHDNGPSDAINKGMRMARGSILGVVPADDLCLPWTASSVMEAFADSDADFVYGDTMLMPMGAKLASLVFAPAEDRLSEHLGFGPMNLQAAFWRKGVLRELVGFDISLRIAADYDFCIRAARLFKFKKIDDALACFRYRRQSLSVSQEVTLREERKRISARYFGGGPIWSLGTLVYEIKLAKFCTIQALRLVNLSSGEEPGPWANLRHSGAISRPRLVREALTVPAFHTNAVLERSIRHGYIDKETALGLARVG